MIKSVFVKAGARVRGRGGWSGEGRPMIASKRSPVGRDTRVERFIFSGVHWRCRFIDREKITTGQRTKNVRFFFFKISATSR